MSRPINLPAPPPTKSRIPAPTPKFCGNGRRCIPEYSFLPRKFKIAVNGAAKDRAAIRVHDIGYQIVKNAEGEVGFAVYVGGGQGRTPLIAHKIRDFLPKADLLAYTNAILRIYNLEGRRDNKFKARIKILLHEKGADVIRAEVEAEFADHRDEALALPQEEIDRIRAYFAPPALPARAASSIALERRKASDPAFARFVSQNVVAHKTPGLWDRHDLPKTHRRHSRRRQRRVHGNGRRSRRSIFARRGPRLP